MAPRKAAITVLPIAPDVELPDTISGSHFQLLMILVHFGGSLTVEQAKRDGFNTLGEYLACMLPHVNAGPAVVKLLRDLANIGWIERVGERPISRVSITENSPIQMTFERVIIEEQHVNYDLLAQAMLAEYAAMMNAARDNAEKLHGYTREQIEEWRNGYGEKNLEIDRLKQELRRKDDIISTLEKGKTRAEQNNSALLNGINEHLRGKDAHS